MIRSRMFATLLVLAGVAVLLAGCSGLPGSPMGRTSGPVMPAPTFDDGMVIQQDRFGHGSITVWGRCDGDAPVEARVVADDDGTEVAGWRVVDPRPGGHAFIGRVDGIPSGGWYRVELRCGDGPVHRVDDRFGVGVLVACAGQSNMERWLTKGSAFTSEPVSVLRDRHWRPSSTSGATAFGEHLSRTLGLPVGLLDTATGGTAIADGGAMNGYWLASPGSGGPYDEFRDRTRTSGGTLGLVLWIQGESDARAGIAGDEYLGGLRRLWRQMKSDVAGVDPPLLIYPLQDPAWETTGAADPGRPKDWEAVRAAQHDAAEEASDVFVCTSTADLERVGLVHFTDVAYAELGVRMAAAAEALVRGGYPGKTVRFVPRAWDLPPDYVTPHRYDPRYARRSRTGATTSRPSPKRPDGDGRDDDPTRDKEPGTPAEQRGDDHADDDDDDDEREDD